MGGYAPASGYMPTLPDLSSAGLLSLETMRQRAELLQQPEYALLAASQAGDGAAIQRQAEEALAAQQARQKEAEDAVAAQQAALKKQAEDDAAQQAAASDC